LHEGGIMKKLILFTMMILLSGCVCMTKRQYVFWADANRRLGVVQGLNKASEIYNQGRDGKKKDSNYHWEKFKDKLLEELTPKKTREKLNKLSEEL